MDSNKRALVDTNNSSSKRVKSICSFKEKCYRKNPHHFMEYFHPHLDDLLDKTVLELPSNYLDESIVVEQLKILKDLKKPANELWKDFKQGPSTSSQASTSSASSSASTTKPFSASTASTSSARTNITTANFASKLKCNEPYNIFFTVIPDSAQTKIQNNSIQLTDLLCPSLGILSSSLQINFIIDIEWVMTQYALTGNHNKPLTILYGEDVPNMKNYISKFLPHVTEHYVKMSDPFGTHHSKMGVYSYTNGSIRVVVSTANLYFEDWNNYCQGVWVSPLCPVLASDRPDSSGSGPTDFKGSLIKYLQHYNLSILNKWINLINRADFSDVKVFFVNSLPGKYTKQSTDCHLYRVGNLLTQHCKIPDGDNPSTWAVIAQSSSLGNFGQNAGMWLRGALLRSLASNIRRSYPMNSNAKFCVVYPSVKNVLGSYKGEEGGGCLPYSKKTHDKQRWLESLLHEWKADRCHRTRAMPHIKSYCRVSPCNSKLAYYLLTSANISKAAWGSLNKDQTSSVRSYEVGVLFLPSLFEEPYFTIDPKQILTGSLFPFMYDLPLSPYKSGDAPWTQC